MHLILVNLVKEKGGGEKRFLLVVDEIVASYRGFFHTTLGHLIRLIVVLVIDLFHYFFTLLTVSFT